MVITGAAFTIIDNALVALPPALLALTVKFDVPAAVGAPEMVPLAASDKPAGKAPLSMLQVMGAVPVAARV